MTVKIEGNELVVRVPISPHPSKSGKTMLVASTHGAQDAGLEHDGKPIKVSLNAYTPR